LERGAVGYVKVRSAEISAHLSSGAEGSINGAVRQVAGKGEIIIMSWVFGVADSDNLPVRLEENGVDTEKFGNRSSFLSTAIQDPMPRKADARGDKPVCSPRQVLLAIRAEFYGRLLGWEVTASESEWVLMRFSDTGPRDS